MDHDRIRIVRIAKEGSDSGTALRAPPPPPHRKASTRLCLPDHNLSVETLRYPDCYRKYNIPRAWQLGRFCQMNVKDESHVALVCTAHPDLSPLRWGFRTPPRPICRFLPDTGFRPNWPILQPWERECDAISTYGPYFSDRPHLRVFGTFQTIKRCSEPKLHELVVFWPKKKTSTSNRTWDTIWPRAAIFVRSGPVLILYFCPTTVNLERYNKRSSGSPPRGICSPARFVSSRQKQYLLDRVVAARVQGSSWIHCRFSKSTPHRICMPQDSDQLKPPLSSNSRNQYIQHSPPV
jgi:hypothetical protein